MLVDLTNGESYPSFADPDFADVFLAADVLRAAAWVTRSPDAKGRGLVSATRMLVRLPWIVDPAPDPTALAADIPETLQGATAMLAADLLAKPRLFSDASGSSNVKTARAGGASVEFFRPVQGQAPIPTAIWDMLLAAGLVGTAGSDDIPEPFVSGINRNRHQWDRWGGGCEPLGGRCADDWPITGLDYD